MFIGDPFKKKIFEEAAKDISYEKRWNQQDGFMMYKLKKPRREGLDFINSFGTLLMENGEQMKLNRKSAEEGKFIFWDEEVHIDA